MPEGSGSLQNRPLHKSSDLLIAGWIIYSVTIAVRGRKKLPTLPLLDRVSLPVN